MKFFGFLRKIIFLKICDKVGFSLLKYIHNLATVS